MTFFLAITFCATLKSSRLPTAADRLGISSLRGSDCHLPRLERRPKPDDAYSSVISPTGKGFNLIERVVKKYVASQHAFVEETGLNDRNQRKSDLTAWLALLEKFEATAPDVIS